MSALLEHGADASATEPNRGATALHLAATNPQARGATAALLAHGADAWAKDKAGDTPTDRHHTCVAEARTTGVARAAEGQADVASAVEAKAGAAAAASEPAATASAPAPEDSRAEAGGGGEEERPAAALLLLPDIDPDARRGDALRRADWTAIGTGHFSEGKHELTLTLALTLALHLTTLALTLALTLTRQARAGGAAPIRCLAGLRSADLYLNPNPNPSPSPNPNPNPNPNTKP